MKVLPNNNEVRLIQPGLFDIPEDANIVKIKDLIKDLTTENWLRKTSMSRFDIERSIVEAYKSLSKAYENKSDEQLHYKKVSDTLTWILFNSKNKKLHPAKKIRDHILKTVQGIDNKDANTARYLAQLWRNLLTASIHAAKGVAQEEFPIQVE